MTEIQEVLDQFYYSRLHTSKTEKNKLLREELNNMNKDGINYMIKNGKIVPRRT